MPWTCFTESFRQDVHSVSGIDELFAGHASAVNSACRARTLTRYDDTFASVTRKTGEDRNCSIGVQALASDCPRLTTLDLGYFNKIADVGVQALATTALGSPTTKSRMLHCRLCPAVGPGLTTLNLCDCAKITDVGVQSLASGCPGPTSLGLRYCSRSSDIGVQALPGSCPRLTSLSFLGARRSLASECRLQANSCPHFTSLDLALCKKNSDF